VQICRDLCCKRADLQLPSFWTCPCSTTEAAIDFLNNSKAQIKSLQTNSFQIKPCFFHSIENLALVRNKKNTSLLITLFLPSRVPKKDDKQIRTTATSNRIRQSCPNHQQQ
jgi:hypothetical protein